MGFTILQTKIITMIYIYQCYSIDIRRLLPNKSKVRKYCLYTVHIKILTSLFHYNFINISFKLDYIPKILQISVNSYLVR